MPGRIFARALESWQLGLGRLLGPRQASVEYVCLFHSLWPHNSGPLYCCLSVGPILLLLCAYASASMTSEWAPSGGLGPTVCVMLGFSIHV